MAKILVSEKEKAVFVKTLITSLSFFVSKVPNDSYLSSIPDFKTEGAWSIR